MKISSLLAFVSLLVLTACNGNPFSKEEPLRISCPEIFILKDTDRVARFLPDRVDPAIKHLLFEARSTFGDGECNMKNGRLNVTFKIGAYVKVTSLFDDPNSAPVSEKVQMFVGVRDKAGKIVSRDAIDLQLIQEADDNDGPKGTPLLRAFFKNKQEYDDLFPEDLLKIGTEVSVDINASPQENPRDYRIYLGFVISESELANNRRGYLPKF